MAETRIYLVRHIESHEVQGLFWGSPREIWDQMDEIGNPTEFEFATLMPGALYTHAPIGSGPVPLQFDDMEEDSPGMSWAGFAPLRNPWRATPRVECHALASL